MLFHTERQVPVICQAVRRTLDSAPTGVGLGQNTAPASVSESLAQLGLSHYLRPQMLHPNGLHLSRALMRSSPPRGIQHITRRGQTYRHEIASRLKSNHLPGLQFLISGQVWG